jgi:predicted regulator of amino acid metabolism with ACT domain
MMIIAQLVKGVPMSISKLARKTGLDRRTVGKVLELLLKVQDTLFSYKLEIDRVGNTYVVKLREMVEELRRSVGSTIEIVGKGEED